MLRTFDFKENFVSCMHCERCYGCVMGEDGKLIYSIDNKPIRNYCQEFNCQIDQEDVAQNKKRAKNCDCWHPEGLRRDVLIYKEEEDKYKSY